MGIKMKNLKFAFDFFRKKPDPIEKFTKAIVAKYSSGNTSLQNLDQGYITQDQLELLKKKASRLKISY